MKTTSAMLLVVLLFGACSTKLDHVQNDRPPLVEPGVRTQGVLHMVADELQYHYFNHKSFPEKLSEREPPLSSETAPVIPLDEWGNAILYQPVGENRVLTSPGQDGRIGTDDDIEHLVTVEDALDYRNRIDRAVQEYRERHPDQGEHNIDKADKEKIPLIRRGAEPEK